MTDSTQIIDDISPLLEINPSYIWIWVLLSVVFIILIAIGVFLWFKKIKKSKKLPTPFEKLTQELQKINPQTHPLKIKPFCFKLSLSLREYLSPVWKIDATESTSKEFLSLILQVAPQYVEIFTNFCNTTDLVKFAKKNLSLKESSNLWKQIKTTCHQINIEEEHKQKEIKNNV